MALVVFLRGVNVGGHRVFRPAELERRLEHLGAVNIGAAGTFVIRQRVTRARLRAELAQHLPFDTEVVICEGREVSRLLSRARFSRSPARPGTVRFVSVLARVPRVEPHLPMSFPPRGPWLLQLLARDGRFVIGRYRRHMKTIGYLGMADQLYEVPLTTRNWNTMTAIARILEAGG